MNLNNQGADVSVPLQNDPNAGSLKTYHVGTLSYTKRGLIVLFAWMLWGDFCFTLMETVVPYILPLKLKSLGAANTTIALITTTLPSILNMTVCPWVSFRSDRHRSKWGRRIPFILFTLPFLTLFLLLLGFGQQIGTWLHTVAFAHSGLLSATTVSVILIGIFMVGFQFFNMFVGSVYWYFFNDVVPEQFIGRFLGLFRLVGSLASAVFNFFIIKYAESHTTEIFVGTAILYFIGFGLMCLKVKEGDYPPPPENVDGKQGFYSSLKTFMIECYSIRFYWFMFAMTTFHLVAGSATMMFNLFFLKEIGLTLEDYGRIAGVAGIIGAVLTYPAGIIADKYHPLRVQIVMKGILLFMIPLNLIFLVVRISPGFAYYYYMAVTMVALPATVLYSASQFPTEMRIFPKDRFGQFCSAQALVRSVGIILSSLVIGGLFDLLKWVYNGSDYAYRWFPAVIWLLEILAFFCLIQVYRGWKRYGGLEHYQPPLPEKNPDNIPMQAIPKMSTLLEPAQQE
jgi:maltose/moltooligosaccharide transporter